jgi:hypothetical protein
MAISTDNKLEQVLQLMRKQVNVLSGNIVISDQPYTA